MSPIPDASTCTDATDRDPSAPLMDMPNQLKVPPVKNSAVMNSRIEVDDGGSKRSVCVRGNGSGCIEFFGDVHAGTTRSNVVGTANVATNRCTTDAESRGNGGVGIDGGSECKEEESGDVGL